MWDILLQNLPTVIVVIIAIIFCGVDIIKIKNTYSEEQKKMIDVAIEEHQKEFDMQAEFSALHERFNQIDKKLNQLEKRMETAEIRLEDLTISDMHDIKSWIVDQYHKFYVDQGWIDAFNAEIIERRFKDYQKEGGNSYIQVLIDRLHELPMDPPQRKE